MNKEEICNDPNSVNAPAATGEQFYATYPVGLMPMLIISSETLRKVREMEEERAKNKNNQPPKPPRRPNARIGRTALSSGY